MNENSIASKKVKRNKAGKFEVEGYRQLVRKREGGIEGIAYDKVLSMMNQGVQILPPQELSYLMCLLVPPYDPRKKIEKEEHWFTRQKRADLWYAYRDTNYEYRRDGAPYWSSQGLGYVCDFEGKFPEEFRGRFILASIKDVDNSKYDKTIPNFDDAIILKDGDLEYMDGWVQEWEDRTESGLAVPVCGKNDKGLGYISLEEILKEFAPLVIGAHNKYISEADEITNTYTPSALLGVWA